MEDLLRSKGLFRIATDQEKKPKDEDKVAKWENRQDQARGLIGMSISPDLRFHIAELDTPKEALEQITKVFGIKNEIRAHQLENELLTLDPNNFSSIEDFLSKFKTLMLALWHRFGAIAQVLSLMATLSSDRSQFRLLE